MAAEQGETVDVTEMMNVGGGDEVGTPDELIEECECGVLYRKGGWHRCGLEEDN